MREWLTDLKMLGADEISIDHALTPRYVRAFSKRHWIVAESICVGWKEGEGASGWEIALWAPHPQGTRKCGYYSALRLWYADKGAFLQGAELYAFYDGDEKSDCLKGAFTAKEYSKQWGFHD